MGARARAGPSGAQRPLPGRAATGARCGGGGRRTRRQPLCRPEGGWVHGGGVGEGRVTAQVWRVGGGGQSFGGRASCGSGLMWL